MHACANDWKLFWSKTETFFFCSVQCICDRKSNYIRNAWGCSEINWLFSQHVAGTRATADWESPHKCQSSTCRYSGKAQRRGRETNWDSDAKTGKTFLFLSGYSCVCAHVCVCVCVFLSVCVAYFRSSLFAGLFCDDPCVLSHNQQPTQGSFLFSAYSSVLQCTKINQEYCGR